MNEVERIRFLRKEELGLSMEEFGKRIGGISKQTISNIENGNRPPTEHIKKSICREFNVSESWLRDGIGEPFVEKSKREQIIGYLNMLSDVSENVRNRFADALDAMDEDDWKVIRDVIDQIERDCIARKNSGPAAAAINENVDTPSVTADLSPEEREVIRQLREKKQQADA